MWFTETQDVRIGRITTAGVITEYSSGLTGSSIFRTGPQMIVAGPDGALWFTESGNQQQPDRIGRITTTAFNPTFNPTIPAVPLLSPWGVLFLATLLFITGGVELHHRIRHRGERRGREQAAVSPPEIVGPKTLLRAGERVDPQQAQAVRGSPVRSSARKCEVEL